MPDDLTNRNDRRKIPGGAVRAALAWLLILPAIASPAAAQDADLATAPSAGEETPASPLDVEPDRLTPQQKDLIAGAFAATHDGYSVDEVILDDARQEQFLAACAMSVPELSPLDRNRALLNLRKAGALVDIRTTRRSERSDLNPVRPLAEIAARRLQDQHAVSVDQIMADPVLREEFNAAVRAIDPEVDAYAARKAAFQLRKTRQLRPELITRIADWDRQITVRPVAEWRVDLESIPEVPGLYVFSDASGYLYVGETDNLRRRLESHLAESDRQALANYLAREECVNVQLEIHTFGAGSRMDEIRVRRACESELIRSRVPRFNIRM
jgi:GIY-YIG catalytic domain